MIEKRLRTTGVKPTEMSTDQDWIRTEANFGRIRTGSDCKFFLIGGSGLDRTEKICDYSNHIKHVSCNVIVQIGEMVMYILPSVAKALLGRFCCASNFVQTPHIVLSSYY